VATVPPVLLTVFVAEEDGLHAHTYNITTFWVDTIPVGHHSKVPMMAENDRVMATFAAVTSSFLAVTGTLASGQLTFYCQQVRRFDLPGFFANI